MHVRTEEQFDPETQEVYDLSNPADSARYAAQLFWWSKQKEEEPSPEEESQWWIEEVLGSNEHLFVEVLLRTREEASYRQCYGGGPRGFKGYRSDFSDWSRWLAVHKMR